MYTLKEEGKITRSMVEKSRRSDQESRRSDQAARRSDPAASQRTRISAVASMNPTVWYGKLCASANLRTCTEACSGKGKIFRKTPFPQVKVPIPQNISHDCLDAQRSGAHDDEHI